MSDNVWEQHGLAVVELQRQLDVADKEFADASTVRLERKHRRDEFRSQLHEKIANGPFAEEKKDPQMRLFDDSAFEDPTDDEDDEDEDGLIDELQVPAAIRVSLKKLGVETMEDLGLIIDGKNKTYPNGIDDLVTMDVDARKRVLAAYNDQREEPDAEDDHVPYAPPLPASEPVSPVAGSTEVKIKLKKSIDGTKLAEGDELTAVKTATGSVIVAYGDGEDEKIVVEEGEYAFA